MRGRKVMVEVGILIVIVFGMLILVTALIIVNSNRQSYLAGRVEKMGQDMEKMSKTTFSSIVSTDDYPWDIVAWGLDYARMHSDNEEFGNLTNEERDVFLSKDDWANPFYGLPLDMDTIMGMSEEEKELCARSIYLFLGWNYRAAYAEINYEWEEYTYFFMDAHPETMGMYYYYSSIVDPEEAYPNKYHALGRIDSTIVPSEDIQDQLYDFGSDEPLFRYERKKTVKGEQLLVGYYPVIYTKADGSKEIIGLMGVVHNWTTYYRSLVDSLLKWTIIAVCGMVFAEITILTFLYLTILRPLKQIQKGVQTYTLYKDRKMVQTDMQSIKQINEVGKLSRDLLQLMEEYENYMAENVRIAGERERVGAELVLATRFQKEMLPKDFPDNSHYDLYALMQPAREVGGDFYDFFMLDNEHLVFLIADVSDKGMSAAFFMAVSKTLINSRAQMGGDPVKILEYVDHWLEHNNSQGQFVTVWIGILNINSGELSVCNAGHDYPAIMQNGEDYMIEKTPHGHPIAFLPGMNIRQEGYQIRLQPGDKIFLYTDGVLDEQRADGERFEKDRLLETLNKNKEVGSKELLHRVLDAVVEFGGEKGQFDDITMVALTYKGKKDE